MNSEWAVWGKEKSVEWVEESEKNIQIPRMENLISGKCGIATYFLKKKDVRNICERLGFD